MHKAGFLTELADTMNLYSPPEMAAEAGFNNLNMSSVTCTSSSSSHDQKFLTIALKLRWPVVSEDKNILLHMQRSKLPYFNSLMMLNFLLFRKRIDLKAHAVYFKRLKKFAWYSPQVWEFGKNIYNAIADLS
jgi:hypothetical protein